MRVECYSKFLSRVKQICKLNMQNVRRAVFTLSLAAFLFSVFMISVTLLDYYRNHKLNENIKNIYYNVQRNEIQELAGEGTEYAESLDNTPASGSGSQNVQNQDPPSVTDGVYESGGSQSSNSSGYSNRYEYLESIKETDEDEIRKRQFEILAIMNSHAVGWIQIPGTNIDYPVLQYKDNEYYLKRDFRRKRNKGGSIFMDYRNNTKKKDKNIILYGHNMLDNSMFQDLTKYRYKEFFNNNKIINFDIRGEHYQWEIFSVYVTGIDFDYLITEFKDTKEYKNYLSMITKKSLFKSNISLDGKSRILTLSTCVYDFENARLVVHARLIE